MRQNFRESLNSTNFVKKSFANPIAVGHITCQFQLRHWVFTNETFVNASFFAEFAKL